MSVPPAPHDATDATVRAYCDGWAAGSASAVERAAELTHGACDAAIEHWRQLATWTPAELASLRTLRTVDPDRGMVPTPIRRPYA